MGYFERMRPRVQTLRQLLECDPFMLSREVSFGRVPIGLGRSTLIAPPLVGAEYVARVQAMRACVAEVADRLEPVVRWPE